MHDCWLPAVPVFVQLSTNATGERAGDGPNSRRPDSRMEFPVEVLGSGLPGPAPAMQPFGDRTKGWKIHSLSTFPTSL